MADPGDARLEDFNAAHSRALEVDSAERMGQSDQPRAEAPLRRVGSERELNAETQLDKDFVQDKRSLELEETEEVEKRSSISSSVREPRKAPLKRMQSSATTATTATSASDLSRSESRDQQQPPRKWYSWLMLRHRHLPPIPTERKVSREYKASIWSKATFQWITPLMTVGYNRPLELNDIYLVNPKRSADVLTDRLQAAFEKRVADNHKRPLLAAMHETFKKSFYIGAACQFTASILQVINPFILRYLITFSGEAYYANVLHTPGPNIGRGIGLVVAITAIQVIQNACTNQFMYHGMVNGGQVRASLISIIFDKSLRISGRARAGGRASRLDPVAESYGTAAPGSQEEKAWFRRKLSGRSTKQKPEPLSPVERGLRGDGQGYSNGRIVNLMSTDTYRVDQASGMFHMVWTAPISILVTLVLLLINLRASALAGFGLLVVVMPLLAKAIKILIARRRAVNKITDQRVSLTQEVLHAVRFIKYFGWETSFLGRLSNLRSQEIRSIQFILAIRNGINAVSMSMPIFAAMLAFIAYAYTHTGSQFEPARIFSSLALFNSIRLPLNMLPLVLGQVTDAVSSIGRIQDFLLAEDEQDSAIWDYKSTHAVVIENGSFTWEKAAKKDDEEEVDATKDAKQVRADLKVAKKAKRASKKMSKDEAAVKDLESSDPGSDQAAFAIDHLNLSIGRQELIAVIGGVGSGKTSLLAALAGDMRKTSGTLALGASRAFCPQSAWIQNATVKDNILFGKDMKRSWYHEVIDACALRPDLEMLPGGDLTEIGEKGITVSGGQKQRLNIARAIYFDSDIILLDDPLSAVDAHVGRHIMDQAICGLLKDKCRILATHQLWVLNRVDRVVWMDNGKIRASGSYDNLMANDQDFRNLIANNAEDEKKEAETKVDGDEIEEEKKNSKKRKGKKPKGALMQAEERAVSSVSFGVYHAYIKASGSILVLPFVFGLLVMAQGGNIVTSLWLSWWTSNKFHYSTGTYVGVYAALGFAQAILMFLFSVALSIFGTEASKVMLHRAITKVLRAPMSFFDTTPLGRITNRFSKDIDTMDNTLTDNMRFFFVTLAMIVSVFILIIAYYYYFAVALAPLLFLFFFSASFYRASAREVKRHESVLRSTVFARFSEAVTGTATIRAYGLQNRFSKSIRDAVDDMDSAYFLTFANQRWLSTRLDLIGNVLVFVLGILVVTSRFSINPSTGGLVLSYILTIVQMIQFTIRQLAEVENNMNATERIHYYGSNLEEEPPLTLPNPKVTPEWPQHGQIEFANVEMRYRDGLPLVLKGLNLSVIGGERIGIVGRTGAGKSSIMSTLFRLVELSGGSIAIDGIDISTVGLETLRSRLSIIPQDPTLFKGTVRSNLDPFGRYSDHELWAALKAADLVGLSPSSSESEVGSDSASVAEKRWPISGADEKIAEKEAAQRPASSAPPAGTSPNRIMLDTQVIEEGLNFSLGQRQLMALARALVRNSQIIVCDEATSSVDMETDERIQRTIKSGFRGKTLLCIAHRLRTIIGYDRIVVMDQGQIAEIGPPRELYAVEGSIFRSMCERSGIRKSDFE
ncbi:MAG: hypothetical protein Q9159_007319 [Coniocarpon cinnabarinum]